ncbi:metal dependent phosphohydrolase [Candidatus Scalindua japonica]|uniref:Metal dependent phosphohydrolase n=1 Tax=Candidatus Scalindua japonica TaxID=1284222 RepID=A0A286TY62_9BACT|nr:HD domain-containing phosphohydrolase [Candidatus Scalindua japonica]GAX60833.1 metal dependent phosphohydrolase [Candidatus Scalindua japonica]
MSEYIAITKNALVEGTKIEFDLFLRNDFNGRSRYILFCRGNQLFSPQLREELLNKKVEQFYISSEDTDKYLIYQEQNLNQIVTDSSKSSLQKSGALYQVAKNLTRDIMADPIPTQTVKRASAWVGNTITHIIQNENTFSSLFEVTSRDYHIYTHSINTSVIGLLFGKYLALDSKELKNLGTGLLLHDIGKTKIPSEIINNRRNLTSQEFGIIKKHPKLGLNILDQFINIDGASLKIVVQHHENNDGTGYPYGIGGNEIHLFGHISRIVDSYDAMTSNRPYASAMKPFATLAEIKKEMQGCFDDELLKEFICFLGLKDPRKKPRDDNILQMNTS